MSEYEGITYNLAKQEVKPWGIEVITLFTRNGKSKTKMFVFIDQADITANYDTRMESAIDRFIDARERLISPQEIVDKILNYFQTNTELTRQQAINFMNEKIIIEDAI